MGVLGSGFWGLEGITSFTGGSAVVGNAYGSGNVGVQGDTANASGYGVYGTNTANGIGVDGNGATGVAGNGGVGVDGQSNTSDGVGVKGEADTGSGAIGVNGVSATGYGVYGIGNHAGVYGSSGSGSGVQGESSTYGVYGSSSGYGVYGDSNTVGGAGVYGFNPANIGVYGQGGYAVYGSGFGNGSTAIYGNSVGTGSYAGYFSGNVNVTGTCCAAEQGTYRIDDPLDPANKYLNQAAVESQDMLDVLNGNVTTDDHGNASISLPAYFQTTNRDFRYQLTIVGDQFAQVRVSSTLQDNHFSIQTDKPAIEVSWQITGVRDDPYANAHPLTPEQDKPSDERGYYLSPDLYGQPASKGIGSIHNIVLPSTPLTQPTQLGGK